MIDPHTNKEGAIAVQETAKAVGKGIDALQDFGKFVAKFIAGSLEEGMGIVEDKLKYTRWENQVRFMARANGLLNQLSISSPTRPIPLKIAIPLFHAASLEEEESMQDLWASLLVNAANAQSGVDVKRMYIDILERINPLEAQILNAIYSLKPTDSLTHGFWTRNLPEFAELAVVLSQEGSNDFPSSETVLALANLERLGCLDVDQAFNGGRLYSRVFRTELGWAFFKACTLETKSSHAE